jgi:hypothetical protein
VEADAGGPLASKWATVSKGEEAGGEARRGRRVNGPGCWHVVPDVILPTW